MKICVIDSCTNEAGLPGTAKGLCRRHYKKQYRYGNANEPDRRKYTWDGETCIVDKCTRRPVSLQMCEAHYAAQRRKENPANYQSAQQRFRAKKLKIQEELAGRSKPDRCELCQEKAGRIVWDHCHDSGQFRGWLCDRCNRVLGSVKDDVLLLQKMKDYLLKH